MSSHCQPGHIDAGPHGPVPQSVFLTDALPVADRFDLWRDSILPLFDSYPDGSRDHFHAQVESIELGPVLLAHSSFSPLHFHRDRHHCLAEGTDHLLVQLYLSGGYAGENGSRDVRVAPGDISLLDLGRPLHSRASASSLLSLIIPRDSFHEYLPPSRLRHGHVIPGDSPVGQVLGQCLRTVWTQLHRASGNDLAAIRRLLLSSVAAAFDGEPDDPGWASRQMMLENIRAYIARNLGQPITPDDLCRRFACSRAQLYRLFRPAGGVAAYIRDCRLRRCWRELAEAPAQHQRVLDIALRWGFGSQSHFTRAFRASFGVTPGDVLGRERAGRTARTAGLPELHGILRRL